jgi:hypothetical protein
MKNNANTLVIFGAPDHEESLARKIAEAAGCMTGTAFYSTGMEGQAVHAGTAYKANGHMVDSPADRDDLALVKRVIFFECSKSSANGRYPEAEEVVCDHHRPGDPGYDKGPDEFWMGSSLGQLCSILFPDRGCSSAASAAWLLSDGKFHIFDGNLDTILMVAAADHCPADVYAGRCHEIDQEDFFEFRLRQKAEFEFNSLSEERRGNTTLMNIKTEITHNIQDAERFLAKARKVNDIADLREYDMIPDLPEAAMKTGKKYMAKIDETDRAGNPTGNKKIVLGGCCTPEDVTSFMEWAGQLGNKMGEPYGVPARGFAGVVVTEPYCPTCKGEYLHMSTCCQSCGTAWPEFG